MNNNLNSLEIIASNIRGGVDKTTYGKTEFLAVYPQFASVPDVVIDMYVEAAQESILKTRWFSKWKIAIGLYIAHNVTLWAETAATGALTPAELASGGESKGAVMSKSMDGLSVSYGQSAGENDLVGWGTLKNTLFGQQLATMAKDVGRGGMYII